MGGFGMYAVVNCWKLEFVRVTQNSGRAGGPTSLETSWLMSVQSLLWSIATQDAGRQSGLLVAQLPLCAVETDGQANTVTRLASVWLPSASLWNDHHDPFNQICHCFLNCGLVCIRTPIWIGQSWMFQPNLLLYHTYHTHFTMCSHTLD